MNHYPAVTTSSGNAEGAVNTRAFLQQAVDHYPRLVVFSFTLVLPYRETMTDYRSWLLRFHTEVWLRTGEYSGKRQQARYHSPPTILRWMWESVSAPECRMVLLMNLDTLVAMRNPPLVDSVMQEMYAIISDAWRTVTEADNSVAGMSSFILSRTERCLFTRQFSQLQTRVNEMASPDVTARTGVLCP